MFEAIISRLPPPEGDTAGPLTALIFDANYDQFRGTVVSCRVFSGSVRAGDTIRFMSNDATYRVEEVGVFRLKKKMEKLETEAERQSIKTAMEAVLKKYHREYFREYEKMENQEPRRR